MGVANPATEVLGLANSGFASLAVTRGEPGLGPKAWRPLIVVRSDRAVEPTVGQSPKHGVGPYQKKGEKDTSSKAGATRGIGSSSSIPSKHRSEDEIAVEGIFSAHSDGMMVIIRKA